MLSRSTLTDIEVMLSFFVHQYNMFARSAGSVTIKARLRLKVMEGHVHNAELAPKLRQTFL